LGVGSADEDDLYDAMLWLLARQPRIERKLAARHLRDDETVFYDISSSYYEGRTCPLARFGHNRDEKKGRPIMVHGLLADKDGRPICVEVYEGNRADPTTVHDQVQTLRERFGLQRVVLAGDRGMLSSRQINELKEFPGLGWISALRNVAIGKLVESGALQMSLFDTRNLVEFRSEEYPGERLIGCYNAILAEDRRRTRNELLDCTEQALLKIRAEIERRTRNPMDKATIGQKVGRVFNRYKMRKHFKVHIEEGGLRFERNEQSIVTEAALDGIYVVRTSEPADRLPKDEAVRQYKNLAQSGFPN
jgi:transposase